MANIAEYSMNDLAKNLTMTVEIKGMKWYSFKLKIARVLLIIACWIINCKLELQDN
jgi:hypothetical protein